MKKKLLTLVIVLAMAMTAASAFIACNGNDEHECSFGAWTVTTAAICTQAGVETRVCQNEDCDEYETRPIAALGHNMVDTTVATAATCIAEGIMNTTCDRDGCTHTGTRVIPINPNAHNAIRGTLYSAATCTDDAVFNYVCEDCGVFIETRADIGSAISTTGHGEFVWRVITPATATVDGLQGYVCEDCNFPKPQGTTKPITAGLTFEAIGSPATAYRLTGGALSATVIYIPPTHNGLPVTHISNNAFMNRANITSAFFPYSIVATEGSLNNGSFRNSGLTSVTFAPNSNLITLGIDAFRETNLTSIIIPANVELIGNQAFQGTNLTSVVIPASVIRIGNSAFRESSLETLIVEEGSQLNSIGANAFTDSNLTSIVIPLSLTEPTNPLFTTGGDNIGNNVFLGLENTLTTVFFGGADTAAWEEITIFDSAGNDPLLDATRYYFSATPTMSGRFWRWVDGVPTPWTPIKYVSAGSTHSMALDSNGNVWTWGNGGNGRLGHGDLDNRLVPTMITYAPFVAVTITAISAWGTHSMALDDDGNVWSWGSGGNGQLGHGANLVRNVPTRITYAPFAAVTITDISAGNFHSIALDSDGNVWSWGFGTSGRLGHNSMADRNVPTRITYAPFAAVTITDISAGSAHNMALDDDGNVWSWGLGGSGRLGHDDSDHRLVPTRITYAPFAAVTITDISAGSAHSMALDDDGNVWSWGLGTSGQLGHDDSDNRLVPTMITYAPFAAVTITDISAGGGHNMVLDSNGNVWLWGLGISGQLGHNDTTSILVPTMITHPAFYAVTIVAISARNNHSMALDSSGNAWSWGNGDNGRLGHDDETQRNIPIRITYWD